MEVAVIVLPLTALFVFNVFEENSKFVSKIEVTPFFSYDSVQYTAHHSVGIVILALIFALFISLLLAEFLATRI